MAGTIRWIVDAVSEGRQRHGLRGVLSRWLNRQTRRWRSSVTRRDIAEALRRAGVPPGGIICVHSSLSRLGYVEGGAETVIDGVCDAVGSAGTVLMPSFPMDGPMIEYLEQGPVFDVRTTPSVSGKVTEAFRRRGEVIRSLHPTNPVCAWGARAEELTRDHERSITPFGGDTPYGRIAVRDDSYIVMLETHIHSFLHYLQERIGLPTLFLPEERSVPVIDRDGRRRYVRTKVMRPYVPYFMAIPGAPGPGPEWVEIRDVVLIYPPQREFEIRELGYSLAGWPRAWERRAHLERTGVLRRARLGDGEVGVLHVGGLLAAVEREMQDLVTRFHASYDPARIAALGKEIR